MIRHVVVFRWNDSITDAHLAAMSAALDALPGLIPAIASYRHGPDLGIAPTNYDYVIVADFDSTDDFAVYRDHPDHQRMIAEHIVERVADRAAVQYEIER